MLSQRPRACSVTVSGFPRSSAFSALNGDYKTQSNLRGGKPWYRGPHHQQLFFSGTKWKLMSSTGSKLWAVTAKNTATPELVPQMAVWSLFKDGTFKAKSTQIQLKCKA
eukprot:RCo002211